MLIATGKLLLYRLFVKNSLTSLHPNNNRNHIIDRMQNRYLLRRMSECSATPVLTNWNEESVCSMFEIYDSNQQHKVGYTPLIRQLKQDLGTDITVLDYGCGYGVMARRLIQENFHRVEAVDISEAMINRATNHPIHESIKYRKINSAELPFADDYFDAAICTLVLLNISKREDFVNVIGEVYRVLKPNGILYILDPNPDQTQLGISYEAFQIGDPGIVYRDGELRTSYVKLKNGGTMEIVHTHWARKTYEDTLHSTGFTLDVIKCSATPLSESADNGGLDSEAYSPFLIFKATKALKSQ